MMEEIRPEALPPGRRIVVVGTTGSGKTTLASHLARRLELPHVELDSLHWDPNWTPTPTELFRERVREALAGDGWVVDGNYSKVRDLVWQRADTLIWLDYPLPLILRRLLFRTFRRVFRREVLWNNNQEKLRHVFSRDSILLWALTTYGKRRREYPMLLAQEAHRHLRLLHFRTPRETEQWLYLTSRNGSGA